MFGPREMVVKRLKDTSAPGWRAARRFAEWYQSHEVRQVDLAETLGIQQPQVSRYLRGAEALPVKYFDRVAALMGIQTSDLIAEGPGTLWQGDEWPVIAEVHDLPPDVRRTFVDQWRTLLDVYQRGKSSEPAVDHPKEKKRGRGAK